MAISDISDGFPAGLVGGVGLMKCRAQCIAPLLNLLSCFSFVGLFGGIHSALRYCWISRFTPRMEGCAAISKIT